MSALNTTSQHTMSKKFVMCVNCRPRNSRQNIDHWRDVELHQRRRP